jgi:hypothetical protein
VKRFWKSSNHDLESELRKRRPEPRSEFLASLAADVSRQRGNRMGARVALAGALSVVMLTIFAGLGGIGYAASAVQKAKGVTKVARVVGWSHAKSHAQPVRAKSSGTAVKKSALRSSTSRSSGGFMLAQTSKSPADDEYKPGKGCGDKNHVHERENECKKLK